MDTAATNRLEAGDRIGNYRIECEASRDARLVAYRAVHVVLPRRAIVKLMHGPSDQPLIVHMLREACMLDALDHPGIVRIYDAGLYEGRPWFAAELADGPTIQSLAPGAIERVEALALLRDLAEVLEHASRRGVVHCGLRPDRVVMTDHSRGYPICITDWCDARAHDADPQRPAASRYTSPELASGDPIDDRTDVFAVGVIAYEMLTGRVPFGGGVCAVVDDGTPQHVPTEVHCPDVPPELTKLVDSMLAYDRWDRPSIAEVFAELSWLADVPTTPIVSRPRAAGSVRIRRPRWTPALSFSHDRVKTVTDLASKPPGDGDERE